MHAYLLTEGDEEAGESVDPALLPYFLSGGDDAADG
jgi:hypothetical protein